VESEIMGKRSGQQMQPKTRELLAKLRADAFLEIREGYVDTGAIPGKDTSWRDPAQLKPETTTKEEVASHHHRKRLLWVVPVPGTDKNGNFSTAQNSDRSGDAAPPATGSANRPASDPPPSRDGHTAPSKP